MANISHHPPGPKSRLPGDQLFAFRRSPLRFLLKVARTYGDISSFRVGPQQVYLLNHPDLIKDVLETHQSQFSKSKTLQRAKGLLGEGLLTSEGAQHRQQRRLVQPAFHHTRLNRYGVMMVEHAARLSQRWMDGQRLDIAREMRRLTLFIAGKTLFDADVEADADEVVQALTQAMGMVGLARTPVLPFVTLLKRSLMSGRRLPPSPVREQLDAVIYRIINERRRSGTDRGDLLSMLLAAQDEESGRRMTDEQVRDEAMTLFLAGHETTANALSWTWYLLSQHNEVEAKLHEEIDTVLAGRLPKAEDFARLRYVEMVFAEAMRLYPPVWTLGRSPISDYEVQGYPVPAGALVLLSQYVMHHDARYFPEPFRFDPERWQPEARESRPRFSYFPFGGGARRCIGEGFAWLEGVLLIATLAREWRARPVPGHVVEPQALITLRPKRALPMILERRRRPQVTPNAVQPL